MYSKAFHIVKPIYYTTIRLNANEKQRQKTENEIKISI